MESHRKALPFLQRDPQMDFSLRVRSTFTKFTGSKSMALVGKNFMEHVKSFIPNHQIKNNMDKNHFRLRNRTPLSVGRYLPWPKSVYDFRFRFFLDLFGKMIRIVYFYFTIGSTKLTLLSGPSFDQLKCVKASCYGSCSRTLRFQKELIRRFLNARW